MSERMAPSDSLAKDINPQLKSRFDCDHVKPWSLVENKIEEDSLVVLQTHPEPPSKKSINTGPNSFMDCRSEGETLLQIPPKSEVL